MRLADLFRALIARVVASSTARRRRAAAPAALQLRGRHSERAAVAWALAQSYNGRKKAAAALLRWRWRHAERQQRAASIAAVCLAPAGLRLRRRRASALCPSYALEEWASPPPHRHARRRRASPPPLRRRARRRPRAPSVCSVARPASVLAGAVRRSVDSHDVNRPPARDAPRAATAVCLRPTRGGGGGGGARAPDRARWPASRSTPLWSRGWPMRRAPAR